MHSDHPQRIFSCFRVISNGVDAMRMVDGSAWLATPTITSTLRFAPSTSKLVISSHFDLF